MAEPIAEMVRRGDADSIQKYINQHLPSDQPSLERIYKELLAYSSKKEQPQRRQKQHSQRSSSLKQLPKREVHMGGSTSEAAIEKRTNKMIRLLREKGFKVAADDEEAGLQVFRTQRERIVAPLITNAKLLQGGVAEIDRLIERYNANPDFYNNNIEDVHVDLDNNIDRDMREFIDRRQTVLESLRKKQNLEGKHSTRFNHVPSKLLMPQQRRLSHQEAARPVKESAQIRSAQKVMRSCEKEILQQRFKEIGLERNDFRDLQSRLDESGEQLNLAGIINFARVREKMSKEQYDRYTHSYMKMMTTKNQEGSKCKLNTYAKQLLQDERKMRNIIDFSQH